MPTGKLNVSPPVVDLTLYAGDDVEFRLICTDSGGNPVDVSGEMAAQIRVDRTLESTVLAEFEADMDAAADGIIILSMSDELTAGLITDDSGKFTGVWDAQWTASGSEVRTLCQGKVECLADVTRIV
jgi:hypothetical protein